LVVEAAGLDPGGPAADAGAIAPIVASPIAVAVAVLRMADLVGVTLSCGFVFMLLLL
jgi:hypothetical protein